MKKGISAIIISFMLFFAAAVQSISLVTGCAQISAPTGGPRDSLAPVLVSSRPALKSVNVTDNKITLSFNEYVEVKEALTNVLVSPVPKNNPVVDYKLRTVTVRLKDTLQPNTTYSINFGNAIVDVNESNPLTNFTFVFSTGNAIDTLTLSGKIVLAETGKVDSTIYAMLYRNGVDSSVEKRRPDYISRPDGEGKFTFRNLPADNFRLYALKDGDGSKTYNAKTEIFAFAETAITVSDKTAETTLYAYSEEKDTRGTVATAVADAAKAAEKDKKLKYTSVLTAESHDLMSDVVISFNKKLEGFNKAQVQLTDTNFAAVTGANITLDTTGKNIIITHKWPEATNYRLLLSKDITSTDALKLGKDDTLRFTTKKEADYGNLVLRFNNLDSGKHLMLQFVQGDNIVSSWPITTREWSQKLFKPGEYELRLLYDANNNGKWDPGNYSKKTPPERVKVLPQKVSIRSNWDNERDINL
jgi:Bacterial Ig-like domain